MIVYFDGYCNLCNRFVDFLIRHDRRARLRFASLQSRTAERRVPARYTSQYTTMVFQDATDRIYVESGAAIRAIGALGGPYAGMYAFLAVPPFIRDRVYRWVADHRYLWFGKRETCRLPTPGERARFLD